MTKCELSIANCKYFEHSSEHWRSKGQQVGAAVSGRRSWRRINTLFQPFKKAFLGRNLHQNITKNAYFLNKALKMAAGPLLTHVSRGFVLSKSA